MKSYGQGSFVVLSGNKSRNHPNTIGFYACKRTRDISHPKCDRQETKALSTPPYFRYFKGQITILNLNEWSLLIKFCENDEP